MATKDKLVNLEDLKAVYDHTDDRLTALESGAYGEDYDIAVFNRMVVMGLGPKAGPAGTAISVNKETAISGHTGTTGSGSAGISALVVNEETFLSHVHHSETATYEFLFDGAAWHLDGVTVDPFVYGLIYTGTPKAGDCITVSVTGTAFVMNVMDHDYHTPVNGNINHTCTLAMRDCYMNQVFDPPEALIKVVDGLEAGSHFYITLDHGAYNATTAQDGTYGATNIQAIPAGGYIRHTTIGLYQSSTYTPEQITGGKFITYDANFVEIERLDTDTDNSGTDFGTATASTNNGNSEHVNFTQRNQYGDNVLSRSLWLQMANATGTGWWVQKSEFDFPPSGIASLKGFLTGMDADMVSSMVKVKVRVALPNCEGGGYEDVETFVFPLSMTEIGLGQNNGQYETSFGLDNTLKTVPLKFWEGATQEDRIKTLSGAARYWFLRGVYPSNAYGVRIVYPSGALSNYTASDAIGFVAAWVIGNPVIQSA